MYGGAVGPTFHGRPRPAPVTSDLCTAVLLAVYLHGLILHQDGGDVDLEGRRRPCLARPPPLGQRADGGDGRGGSEAGRLGWTLRARLRRPLSVRTWHSGCQRPRVANGGSRKRGGGRPGALRGVPVLPRHDKGSYVTHAHISVCGCMTNCTKESHKKSK